jgi:hypothetical protein
MTTATTKVLTEPSEELQALIVKVGDVYSEALTGFNNAINKALEQGRKEGFTDIEIGDMMRGEQRRRYLLGLPVYTRQTLALSLPPSAKHMEKARTNSNSKTTNVLEESGKTFYQNQEEQVILPTVIKPKVVASTSSVVISEVTQEEEHAEDDESQIYQIQPKDYMITDVERYDKPFLQKLTVYLHDRTQSLEKQLIEANKMIEATQRRNRMLLNSIQDALDNPKDHLDFHRKMAAIKI